MTDGFHTDEDKPMRSQTLQAMFELRGIQASHGRPHTSNDKAFAKSLFATLKGRMLYPENLESLAAAESFAGQIVTWYNEAHRNSFPQRYGTRKKVYGIEETVTLKHRVSLKTENAL